MSKLLQNQLLNFMESSRVKVDQQKKQYDFEIIDYPSAYSQDSESFFYRGIQRRNSWTCRRKCCLNLVPILPGILELTYGRMGVISIGKLVRKSDGFEEIGLIIKTVMKYGVEWDGK